MSFPQPLSFAPYCPPGNRDSSHDDACGPLQPRRGPHCALIPPSLALRTPLIHNGVHWNLGGVAPLSCSRVGADGGAGGIDRRADGDHVSRDDDVSSRSSTLFWKVVNLPEKVVSSHFDFFLAAQDFPQKVASR